MPPQNIKKSQPEAGETFDSIVIGSSPLLLIEALHLEREGQRVAVVEKRNRLGGAWYTRPLVLIINAGSAISILALNMLLIPICGIIGAGLETVSAMIFAQAGFYIFVRRRLGIDPFFLTRG